MDCHFTEHTAHWWASGWSGVITEMPKAMEAVYQKQPCNLEVIQGVFLMEP